jgi:S1-C subfamily serine protease
MSSPRSTTSFPAILLAALMGAGITAGALVGADVVGDGESTTVVQQAPIGANAPAADPSSASGAGKALDGPRHLPPRRAGVVFIRARTIQRSASRSTARGGPAPQASRGRLRDRRRGFILTNAHVVSSTDVGSPSRTRPPRGASSGRTSRTDLALLKVDPRAQLRRSARRLQGRAGRDPTVAIGNPFGLDAR